MPAEEKTQAPGSSAKDRQIRVFISSTFRDMQAERDYLVKFIFPQLRKLCESRGVAWGEVDLRWGVTDEQAAEGQVLPICLEEIKRCRPYFIGLLGERYGWIPETLPDDLVEREDWLKEHLHGKTSVTELEILHGVLRNPRMAGHAYFYFRDPKYVETLGENEKKNFSAEDAKDAEKLRSLKGSIRQSGFPVREDYPDPKTLGELVLDDLTKVINELFPEGSQPDPLDREAMDHEAYAQSRERVYIGRQECFDRLDTHAAASDTQPLVILGESGSGKSALLANWVARYRQAHPDALVLQHYIGATPFSADWAAMLRRLMGEFKRRLGIQQDIPDQPHALRSAFPNWLYTANAKVERPDKTAEETSHPSKIVIVLDALNQLEDRDGAPDLAWLPPVMPENVRLIVSTLPGRPLDEIQKRKWPKLKIELLSADERRKLIAEYLAQHAKGLTAARVDRIANAPQSASPLYLRVLLDELRLVRTHEELEERIGDYLKAESPYALYEKVIARWEQDYGQDLAHQSLCLLWAARCGLSEVELLDLLGKGGQPLPHATWTPFYLAAENAFVLHTGLLNFGHEYLREAVRKRWLGGGATTHQFRNQLAEYFVKINEPTLRKLSELPSLLKHLEQWERLKDLLSDIPTAIAFRASARWELHGCWQKLQSRFDPAKIYPRMLAEFENLHARSPAVADAYTSVAHFFHNWGDANLREEFHRSAFGLRSDILGSDHPTTCDSATFLAQALESKGEYAAAEKLYRQAWDGRTRKLGNEHVDTLKSLNNLAVITSKTSDRIGSENLTAEVFRRCENVLGPNHEMTLRAARNMAYILDLKGNLKAAGLLYRRAAEGVAQIGCDAAVTLSFEEELAMHLRKSGEIAEAESRFDSIFERREKLLGPDNPVTLATLHNLAVLYEKAGRHTEAKAACATSWQRNKYNVIASKPYAISAANELADILLHLKEFGSAVEVYEASYAACKEAYGPAHEQTLVVAINLANALVNSSHATRAETLYADAFEESRRALGADHSVTQDLSQGLSIIHQQHPLLKIRRMLRRVRRLFAI